MVEGQANLSIGGYFVTDERIQLMSPSDSYLESAIGFVYKEGNGRIIPIQSLLAPFNDSLWWAIFGILFPPILIILMLKKLPRKWRHFYIGGRVNRTPVLNMWASTLGHSIGNPRIANGQSIGTFARCLTLFWIILWFIIRSSYEAALYNYLQNKHISSYDTVEKVLKSNCKIISSTSTYLLMKHIINRGR